MITELDFRLSSASNFSSPTETFGTEASVAGDEPVDVVPLQHSLQSMMRHYLLLVTRDFWFSWWVRISWFSWWSWNPGFPGGPGGTDRLCFSVGTVGGCDYDASPKYRGSKKEKMKIKTCNKNLVISEIDSTKIWNALICQLIAMLTYSEMNYDFVTARYGFFLQPGQQQYIDFPISFYSSK